MCRSAKTTGAANLVLRTGAMQQMFFLKSAHMLFYIDAAMHATLTEEAFDVAELSDRSRVAV